MSGHCRWCNRESVVEVQRLTEDGITVQWAHIACETLQKACTHGATTASVAGPDTVPGT